MGVTPSCPVWWAEGYSLTGPKGTPLTFSLPVDRQSETLPSSTTHAGANRLCTELLDLLSRSSIN